MPARDHGQSMGSLAGLGALLQLPVHMADVDYTGTLLARKVQEMSCAPEHSVVAVSIVIDIEPVLDHSQVHFGPDSEHDMR